MGCVAWKTGGGMAAWGLGTVLSMKFQRGRGKEAAAWWVIRSRGGGRNHTRMVGITLTICGDVELCGRKGGA